MRARTTNSSSSCQGVTINTTSKANNTTTIHPDSRIECKEGTSLTIIPADTMSNTTMVPSMSASELDLAAFTSRVYTELNKRKNDLDKQTLTTSSIDETILDTLRAAWEERARTCSTETSISSSPSNSSMVSCSTVIIGEIDNEESAPQTALEYKSDAANPLTTYCRPLNLSYVDGSFNDGEPTLFKKNPHTPIESNTHINRTRSRLNLKPERTVNRHSGNRRLVPTIQSSHFRHPIEGASAVSISTKHGLRPPRPKTKSVKKWLNRRSQSHSSLLSITSSGPSSSSDESLNEENAKKVNGGYMSDKLNHSPTQLQNQSSIEVLPPSQYENMPRTFPTVKSSSGDKASQNYLNQTITDPLTKQTFSRPIIKPDQSRRYKSTNYTHSRCSMSSLTMARQYDSRSTISSLNSQTCSKLNNIFEEVNSKYYSTTDNMIGIVNTTDDVYPRRTITLNKSVARNPIDVHDSERNVTSTDSIMSKSKRYKYLPQLQDKSCETTRLNSTRVNAGVQTELLDKNCSKNQVNQNGKSRIIYNYESSYRMQDPASKTSRKTGVLIVRYADKSTQVNDAKVNIIYDQPECCGDEFFIEGINEKEVQTLESVENLQAEAQAKKLKEQIQNRPFQSILKPLNCNTISQLWMFIIDMLKTIWNCIASIAEYPLQISHPIMPLFWICIGICCTVAIYHLSKPKYNERPTNKLIRIIKDVLLIR